MNGKLTIHKRSDAMIAIEKRVASTIASCVPNSPGDVKKMIGLVGIENALALIDYSQSLLIPLFGHGIMRLIEMNGLQRVYEDE